MSIDTIAATCGGIITIIGMVSLLFKPVRKWFANHFSRKEDPVLCEVKKLSSKLDCIEKKVDENEKDRLKDEIFRFGNIARRNGHITSEEFRNLQRIFKKYTDLGGNDIAHEEYTFVVDCYNEQERRKNHAEQV